MSKIAYKNSGSPQASELNALTSDLDEILRVLFSGKSWLVYQYVGPGSHEGKKFYFGDPGARKIYTSEGEYDHSVYTASAAAKTVAGTDLAKELAYVSEYPVWDLDESLEAHQQTVNVDGTDYDLYLCQVDGGGNPWARERHRRLHVAEIIIEGWDTGVDFDFDSAWDKYHFLRFHNLDGEVRTVNLPGGVSLEIPAFGIQAVRREYKLGSSWDQTYTYLWKCQSGDQLIFDGLMDGSRANNVASLMCFHAWLDEIIDGINPFRRGAYIDPSVCWDGSSLLPQAISGATRLAEYYFHLGDVLSVEEADATPVATRGSLTSWANLEGAGDQGLVATITDDDIEIDAEGTRPTPVDAIGFGTNLLPSHVVELPHTATCPRPNVGGSGQKNQTSTLEAGYSDGVDTIVVTKDYTQGVPSLGWGTASAIRAWDTLDDVAALVAADGGSEVSTIVDAEWKSDGWRMLQTGAIEFDLTTCFAIDGISELLEPATWGSTVVTVPFGVDVFARAFTHTTARRAGRKLSDYAGFTDLSDLVYHQGHPDLQTWEGVAAGVDWNAARVGPRSSVVKKTETVPGQVETLNLPVIPLGDYADRVAANYETAGWWLANRTDLLAETLELSDNQQIVRLPILREHYNQVADRLNSIVAIRPFLFGDVLWWGEIEDGSFSGGGAPVNLALPAGYYCAVLATGSRADSFGITVNSISKVNDAGADTVNYYVTCDDVAAFAASKGFPFLLERLESPQFQAGGSDRRMFSSTDFADAWRQHGNAFVVAHHVSIGSDRLWPPADWPQESATLVAPAIQHERYVETYSGVPASWELNIDSKVLVVPRPIINWDADPIGVWLHPVTFKDIPDGEEVLSAIDPLTTGTVVYGSSEFTGEQTPSTLATLIGESLADGREGFEVRLIDRLFYKRV